MKASVYKIMKLKPADAIPFDLLLLADETKEAIEKYIYHSDVYLIFERDVLRPTAVFALFRISDEEIEIKNIAIIESRQGKGIGSFLIEEIKTIAFKSGYQSIIVGTPDNAHKQIKFYEKNGFVKYSVRKDFFIHNYSKPIFENGIMLRDMLMLKTHLNFIKNCHMEN